MNYVHDSIKERLGLNDLVEVSSFQRDYSDCVKSFVPDMREYENSSVNEKLLRLLDVPPQLFNSLENHCGIHQLECEDGMEIDTVAANDMVSVNIPAGVDLLTVKLQKNELEKRIRNAKYRHACYRSWHSAQPTVTYDEKNKSKEVPSEEKVEVYSDTVLTVQVYRPPKANKQLRTLPETDQEFAVLGSQCLTELRDAITCTCDLAVPGEFSENPDMSQVVRAQDIYRSGFFYINNAFYNDMRDPSNRDYSQVIIKWAEERDRGVGPFGKKLMEDTRICDLKIELGYPYLYMHQGSCEHIIVFTDLRLLGPDDSCIINHYPILQRIFTKRRNPCMICKTYTSKWVTFKNERVTDDPYFFCDICFRCFNYTGDGQKIGNFEAYPYVDKTATN